VPTGSATVGANALPEPGQLSPQIYRPVSRTVPPPGFRLSANQAERLADRNAAVLQAKAEHPDLRGTTYLSPLRLRQGTFWHWDVIYKDGGNDQIVEVELHPVDGSVLQITKEPDIGWPLLLAFPGVLGGKLNAPYIWLPLCLLFVLPFFDPRRPFRLLHLDLLVLLGFGISQWFFTRGEPSVSVPLVYPFLAYVVGRALFAALAPRRRTGSLVPWASTKLLACGLVVLLALRIGFGLAESHTLDISTAGVIGADRIEHGLPLYEENNFHGDTYGPVNYLMYVPFEVAKPYEPGTTGGDAARPATLFFDVLVALGLFVLGRRLRAGPAGTRMGVALAYAWAAFPYSALVIASNTNDALVPLFVIWALVMVASAPARGVLAGLGSMAKFAPAATAPALIAGRERLTLRTALIAGGAWALVCATLILLFLPDGGVREFWNTTIGFQVDRSSPLSLWVRAPEIDWLRPLFTVFALVLIVGAAFVPRRRRTGQLAALCAAVLAAVQIPSNYWLYFYVVWFAPLLFVALFEEHRALGPGQDSATSSLGKPVRISQPASVTTTRSSMRTPSLPGR
jgi:Glycosyltransferase family 87